MTLSKRIKLHYYNFLTLLSPALNTRARYKAVFGKYPDLKHPHTLNEKLMWLKLNGI